MGKQNPYGPVLTAALANSSQTVDVLESRSEGQRLLLESPKSLSQIATAVGVSKQVVGYWKQGRQTPGLPLRYKLQALLNIPAGAWSVGPTGDRGTLVPGLEPVRGKPPPTTAADPPGSGPYTTVRSEAPALPPPPPAPVGPAVRPGGKGSRGPGKGKAAAEADASTPTTMEGVEKLLRTIRAAQEHAGLLPAEQVKLADSETKLLSLRHRLEKESELAEDRIVRQHPKWIRIRTRLAEVLVKWPDAARAVAAALRELDL